MKPWLKRISCSWQNSYLWIHLFITLIQGQEWEFMPQPKIGPKFMFQVMDSCSRFFVMNSAMHSGSLRISNYFTSSYSSFNLLESFVWPLAKYHFWFPIENVKLRVKQNTEFKKSSFWIYQLVHWSFHAPRCFFCYNSHSTRRNI